MLTWLRRASPRANIAQHSNCIDIQGYVVVRFRGRTHKGHRIAWYLHHKQWPTKDIDHINGKRDDNRIENLRLTDIRSNGRNRTEHRAGQLPGAYFSRSKNKWSAQIQINGKIKWLGYFKTQEEAHNTYMTEVKKLET